MPRYQHRTDDLTIHAVHFTPATISLRDAGPLIVTHDADTGQWQLADTGQHIFAGDWIIDHQHDRSTRGILSDHDFHAEYRAVE